MRTRYGTSPWIHGFPDARRPAYARLRGEDAAHVVIVGGGLTGCATAYALAVAGLRPLLIDAGRIGQTGTGRHAGLLLPEPGPAFRDVRQLHGLRAARTLFESWYSATSAAAALLRRTKIRCDLEACDTVLATMPGGERVLRREHETREEAGIAATWLTDAVARRATKLPATAGMRLRGGFTLDPYRACLGLATAAVKRGARLFEQSRATKIKATANDVEVTLERGRVRAGTVIVTTGAATAEIAPLRRHFKRRERYAVLTEPVSAAMRRQLFGADVVLRDAASPRHTFRWTADHRLIVTGADQDEVPEKQRDAVRVQRTGQLMYETLMMYPCISGLRPEYGWEVPYGTTADGLPYIGPHRNYPRHLFALGGDADSITGAFLAAGILTRALQGTPQKGDEAFGWTR